MERQKIEEIISDFIKVCELAHIEMSKNDIVIEILKGGENHVPTNLPRNEMAVYIFMYDIDNSCFKVGRVGTKSNSRYRYQHYDPGKSKSNLAKSISEDPELMQNLEIQTDVENWIKKYTSRINLRMLAMNGFLVLSLFEAFIQNRLKPKYEGYKSQKSSIERSQSTLG